MDHTKTAADIFSKLAKNYQDKFMDVSLYGDTFDLFCEAIQGDQPEVLELACGPGNITRYLLGKRPELRITGLDLAPNMIHLAKLNNPGVEFRIMDCRDIGSIGKTYNAIMCGFLLPYLSKEEVQQLIRDAARLLKPGGVLYLSTMEDDYSKSGLKKGSSGDEIYMHFYEAVQLTGFLKENKLSVLHLDRKRYNAPDGSPITDLIIIAGS